MKIAICICTRNRKEGLQRLLQSIEKMKEPPGCIIEIIVVENDKEPYSRTVVATFSEISKYSLRYFLETRRGISYARNRSVEEAGTCDFCCFVDDDQVVNVNWLIELVKCQVEFNADGVWGINPPVFGRKVPIYIEQFYSPRIIDYGETVSTAYTNCLLLRKSYLDRIPGPFDLRLNFSGGEDIYMAFQFINMGGVIRSNPNALAYEIINNERTRFNYFIRRVLRNSNTSYLIQSLTAKGLSKIKHLPIQLKRFCHGIIILLPFLLFSKNAPMKGLLLILDSIGKLSFLFGKENKFYK